jgi:hypothetical protein
MKTILLLTLLSLNNPKDTTKTCTKKKSCCKQKLIKTEQPKYCVGMLPNDTTKTCTKKKSCCKKKEK